MRFAYIDSNGNEVPIPSVDALALRIELGAISEETQLYDAHADQWGPAHTHEIFHSLSRSTGGDSGFVAPPPVAPSPVAEPSSVAEHPAATESPSPDHDGGAPEREPSSGDVEEDPDTAFGLTLTESDGPAATRPGADDMDLTPGDAFLGPTDELPILGEAPDGPGTFDFGGMDGALEVEGAFMEGPSPSGLGPGSPTESEGGDTRDAGGGMELEATAHFGAGTDDLDEDSSLDLEAPLSTFRPEVAPAWMDHEDEAVPGGVMDFSSVGSAGAEDTDEDVPLRDRRTPRNKPSAPKLRRRRNLAGPIIGVVALLAVGVGGYVAWPVLRATLAARGAPEGSPVTIPEIPEALQPRMRSLAESAFAAIYADVRRDWVTSNPVQAPPREWLAGIYLANAGDFDEVEEFWDGMAEYLTAVRTIDLVTFDAAYAAQAAVQGVTGNDEAVMRERADSGFVAAADARHRTYTTVQTLIEAAIGLHRFLVANEAQIEYVPASTVTTDPVLEADAPPVIRDAMEELIDEVTRALGALGYREQVTASGLWSTVLADIQEVGIQ
jgi:hypothetical protein